MFQKSVAKIKLFICYKNCVIANFSLKHRTYFSSSSFYFSFVNLSQRVDAEKVRESEVSIMNTQSVKIGAGILPRIQAVYFSVEFHP